MAQVYPAAEDEYEGLQPYYGPSGVDIQEGRYASSFIAPNISDFGEVISPAVRDPRELEVEENATRARGWAEYNSLVGAGATPEEAYRRSAHLLHWDHPELMALGLSRVKQPGQEMAFQPSVKTVDGVRMAGLGPERWQVLENGIPKPTLADTTQIRLFRDQINSLRSNPLTQYSPDTPARISALEAQILGIANRVEQPAEQAPVVIPQPRRETVVERTPESLIMSRAAPTQPVAPPPAEVSEVERKTKDGKTAIFDAVTKKFIRYK